MTADGARAEYARAQRELVDALVAGVESPAGFEPSRVAATTRALRVKRAHAVARTWPALAGALALSYGERFAAFAGARAPSPHGALADGLAFHDALEDRGELGDGVRIERLLARAVLVGRGGRVRPRRGPFLGVLLARDPARIVVVTRRPGHPPRARARPSGGGG